MDFLPISHFHNPKEYWNELESEFRNAMWKNVSVQLLISKWNHTSSAQIEYIKSLNKIGQICSKTEGWCTGKIEIRTFEIPDDTRFLPYSFTRVNHAKFLVTDQSTYLSTSNWEKDYFYYCTGLSIVSTHPIRKKIEEVFLRDWNSQYAKKIKS